MINKNNIEILYPGIMVFRKGIPDATKIVDQLLNYNKWEKWYDIGEQIVFNRSMYLRFENFPSSIEWTEQKVNRENKNEDPDLKDIVDLFETRFFEATEYYIKYYNYNMENWIHAGSNILRYEGRDPKEYEIEEKYTNNNLIDKDSHDTTKGQAGGTKEMVLPFHTDFYQREADLPGLKAEYTVTMYLNDDYNGGDIDFRIFNAGENEMRVVGNRLEPRDKNYGEVPEIAYKPQAGDIIIFPSRPPFYHGVHRVTTGTKYFVRMFWMYNLE